MQRRKYEARSASKNVIEAFVPPPVVEEEKENPVMQDKYDEEETKHDNCFGGYNPD